MVWNKDPLENMKKIWDRSERKGVRAQAGGSNRKCKILWDFAVQTDHEIYGRRPDNIVVQKDKILCHIIDFACPYDGRVDTKESKKKTLPRFGTRIEKNMGH